MAEINPAPGTSRRVATVLGGSGFIGRYVVKRLAAAEYVVRVAVPDTEGAQFLKTMGDVGQVVPLHASLTNSDTIARAVVGADLVVNLVGILAERRPGDFQRLHADGAELVAGYATTAGVPRLTHISAIGADPASPSQYARTKGLGEQAVRALFPNAAILRPSLVFGPEDKLFNRFAAMATISPIMPVIAGTTRFQPVFVGDVADAVMATLTQPGNSGITYELGGPRIWTMRDLLAFILTEIRRKRPLVNIPLGLARLQASVLERLPGKMLTRDQLVLLQRDNVVTPGMPGLAELGITPTPVELVVPGYLARFRPGG
jgi:NADH dehydrogenase